MASKTKAKGKAKTKTKVKTKAKMKTKAKVKSEIDIAVGKATTALKDFLKNNPWSSVAVGGKGELAIADAWGDSSLILAIPANPAELYAALNAVILPERFTAIWHRDSKRFEIIYTAFPLGQDEVAGRLFEFDHRGKAHKCWFDQSSDRLLSIAESYKPASPSNTSYRNLGSFRNFVLAGKGMMPSIPGAKPLSFWIEGLDWNDDLALDLVHHLNFYMSYFDSLSPVILVHSPRSENVAEQPQQRFRFNNFPKRIVAKPLDDNLRHFYEASRRGDPIRRFLYSYQILEYAAFYYIEDGIQKALRKLLSAPQATDNLDRISSQILDAISESKISDPQKIEGLLRDTVDPKLIWQDLAQNIEFFSKPTQFDGGFTSPALLKAGWTEADFKVNWLPAFSGALRSIRNALSHGREQRMTAVITPTTANFEKLQCWVPPISTAAQEVMIYQGVN